MSGAKCIMHILVLVQMRRTGWFGFYPNIKSDGKGGLFRNSILTTSIGYHQYFPLILILVLSWISSFVLFTFSIIHRTRTGFVSMYSLRIFIADCCLAILIQLGRDRNEQKCVTEHTGDKFLEFYSYG